MQLTDADNLGLFLRETFASTHMMLQLMWWLLFALIMSTVQIIQIIDMPKEVQQSAIISASVEVKCRGWSVQL